MPMLASNPGPMGGAMQPMVNKGMGVASNPGPMGGSMGVMQPGNTALAGALRGMQSAPASNWFGGTARPQMPTQQPMQTGYGAAPARPGMMQSMGNPGASVASPGANPALMGGAMNPMQPKPMQMGPAPGMGQQPMGGAMNPAAGMGNMVAMMGGRPSMTPGPSLGGGFMSNPGAAQMPGRMAPQPAPPQMAGGNMWGQSGGAPAMQ